MQLAVLAIVRLPIGPYPPGRLERVLKDVLHTIDRAESVLERHASR